MRSAGVRSTKLEVRTDSRHIACLESPAQQLKQQLRRISDPKESPFRLPRSRGHTPRSSVNQLPRLQTPTETPDTSPQDERRASSGSTQATTPSELAANGVSVRIQVNGTKNPNKCIGVRGDAARFDSNNFQANGHGRSLANHHATDAELRTNSEEASR